MLRGSVAWQDVNGDERLTYINTDVGMLVIYLLLQSMSCARVTTTWEGPLQNTIHGTAPAGLYPSVGDVLELRLESIGTFGNRMYLPAPKLSLFDVDSQSFDPTTITSLLLVAGIVGHCIVPLTALPVTGCDRGNLIRRAAGARETYRATVGIAANRRSVVWADGKGQTTMTIQTTTDIGGATCMAAFRDASNAQVTTWWEGPLNPVFNPTPVTGVYQSVRDYADLVFSDTNGSFGHIILPAPLETVFLPDQETVNPNQVDVANLIAAILATCVNPATDTLWDHYVGGTRRHLRTKGLAQGPI
jgi:hypothetical protein